MKEGIICLINVPEYKHKHLSDEQLKKVIQTL